MRILVHARARRDASYDTTYHHKLRGCVWGGLEDTRFTELHGNSETSGFSMSNPFPWGDIEEGDERSVLVASPHEELLAELAAHWLDDRELNIGEMPFEVTDITPVYPDVGEPDTSGVLTTATGVFAKEPGTDTYWRPEATAEPFFEYVEHQLQRQHDEYYPHLPGPEDVDEPLFDESEFIKQYSLPVTVTTGEEQTMVLSKWNFPYVVRDDHHRRHLNLALDLGLGARTGLGFGFLNIVEGGADDIGEREKARVSA
jgi:CRISPR-associated endoribonuclease Cas6